MLEMDHVNFNLVIVFRAMNYNYVPQKIKGMTSDDALCKFVKIKKYTNNSNLPINDCINIIIILRRIF